MAQGRITLERDELHAEFPYSVEHVAAIRNIPCRQWDRERKIWRFPNEPEIAKRLGELALRFGWAVETSAVELPPDEAGDILALGIENGSIKQTAEPEIGYSVRGGGDMLDGSRAYRMVKSNNGAACAYECDADRSGLSGSGRSGYVTYEIGRDGVYMLAETSGSIKRQSTSATYLLLRRGQWYDLGDRLTALMILGIDPEVDARAQDAAEFGDSDDEEI